VDDVFRLAFADHGQHAFVVFRKNGDGTDESPRFGSLAVFDVNSWDIRKEFNSADIIGNGFSCVDASIAAMDVSRLVGGKVVYSLEVWATERAEKLAEHAGNAQPLPHASPWGSTWPHTYECDPATNTMYFRLHRDRVIALDGSTGALLREYVDPGQTEYFDFFIQPERDRLVWVEYQGINATDLAFPAEVRTYRLSTAELTGVLEVMQGALFAIPLEYLYLDPDHIAMLSSPVPGVCNGITIKVLELAGPSVAKVHCVPDRDWGGAVAMGHDSLVVGARRADGCWELRSLELESGREIGRRSLCALAWPGYDAYRSAGRVLVSDSGGAQERWSVLGFPALKTQAEGSWPTVWDAWKPIERTGWLAQQSYHSGEFGLFDLLAGQQVALGPVCAGLVPGAIRVAPGERWVAMLCSGKNPGLAVIDLDDYWPSR
jgi:hypothetical protein